MTRTGRSHTTTAAAAASLTPLSPLERLVIETLRTQRSDADRRTLALALIDAGRRRVGLAVPVAVPTARRA